MPLSDPNYSERIRAAVAAVESRTDAELVVVIAPKSGGYRDIALWAAIGAALLTLMVVLWSPWDFDPLLVPIEVVLGGLVGGLAVRGRPALIRLLTSSSRRRAEVQVAARLAFLAENVHATRAHTGLLIYASRLEGQVVLLPDLGLRGLISEGTWNAVRFGGGPRELTDLEGLLSGLGQIGELLARALPASAENPQELEDAPRVYG